jgi:hypothetical protein
LFDSSIFLQDLTPELFWRAKDQLLGSTYEGITERVETLVRGTGIREGHNRLARESFLVNIAQTSLWLAYQATNDKELTEDDEEDNSDTDDGDDDDDGEDRQNGSMIQLSTTTDIDARPSFPPGHAAPVAASLDNVVCLIDCSISGRQQVVQKVLNADRTMFIQCPLRNGGAMKRDRKKLDNILTMILEEAERVLYATPVTSANAPILLQSFDGTDGIVLMAVAILAKFFDERARLLPKPRTAAQFSKETLRSALLLIESHLPRAAPPRFVMKELSSHFMSKKKAQTKK